MVGGGVEEGCLLVMSVRTCLMSTHLSVVLEKSERVLGGDASVTRPKTLRTE